jgi:hypothetical protein
LQLMVDLLGDVTHLGSLVRSGRTPRLRIFARAMAGPV